MDQVEASVHFPDKIPETVPAAYLGAQKGEAVGAGTVGPRADREGRLVPQGVQDPEMLLSVDPVGVGKEGRFLPRPFLKQFFCPKNFLLGRLAGDRREEGVGVGVAAEVEARPLHLPDLLHRQIGHLGIPAPVSPVLGLLQDEGGHGEDRRGKVHPGKDRGRLIVVVPVAVVEGDRRGLRGKRPALEPPQGLQKGEDTPPLLPEPAHLLGEGEGGDGQDIGLHRLRHPVVHEDPEGSRGGGRPGEEGPGRAPQERDPLAASPEGPGPDEGAVEARIAPGSVADVVAFPDEGPGLLSHAFRVLPVVEGPENSLGDRGRGGLAQDPGLAVGQDVGNAPHAGRDHGDAGSHRLQHHVGKPFPEGGKHKEVEGLEDPGHVPPEPQKAQEGNQSPGLGLRADLPFELPFPGEKNEDLRMAGDDRPEGLEEAPVILLGGKAPDHGQEDPVLGEAQLPPDFGLRLSRRGGE